MCYNIKLRTERDLRREKDAHELLNKARQRVGKKVHQLLIDLSSSQGITLKLNAREIEMESC
jgi:hypothetical protein